MIVKYKKIKKTNHKVKDIQHKYLHHSDYSLLLNHEQQQIVNLCRLIMIVVMSYNISNINDDMFNKWCLYMIEMMLKSRLINIINYHNDDIINKCSQVINLTIKECENLLSLIHYKMTRNFLLNWVAQLSEHLVIVVILIFNNVASVNVVADMLWTVKTTERI